MNFDGSLIINLKSLSDNQFMTSLLDNFPPITNLTANKFFYCVVHSFYGPIIIIKYIFSSLIQVLNKRTKLARLITSEQ